MHVCGTHEHTVSKYGLRSLLPKEVEILSGPGCPVCVCPAADIDKAIELGKRNDTIITTFGDMIRVPATNISLAELKAKGADIRIVYSPNDAIQIAKDNPKKEVIFFAIGFETTIWSAHSGLLRSGHRFARTRFRPAHSFRGSSIGYSL